MSQAPFAPWATEETQSFDVEAPEDTQKEKNNTPSGGQLLGAGAGAQRTTRSASNSSTGSQNSGMTSPSRAPPQRMSSKLRLRSRTTRTMGATPIEKPIVSPQPEAKWEFMSLTQAEIEYVKEMFIAHSPDKSIEGSIPVHHLEQLLLATGYEVPAAETQDLLNQVDTNENGLLEFDEFLQLLKIFKDTAQYRLYESKGFGESTHIAKTVKLYAKALPDAPWRWAWDVFMLVVVMYIIMSLAILHMPDNQEDYESYSDALRIPDIIVTFLIVAQGLVLLNTAVFDVKDFTSDAKTIAKRYVSTRLIFHIIALLPLRLFAASRTPSLILAVFRLAFLITLKDNFTLSGRAVMTRHYINFHYVFVPSIYLVCQFVCLVHVCAVVWFRLFDGHVSYSACVYQTMYFFSSVGYGDYKLATYVSPPGSSVDSSDLMLFASFNCILSLAVNGVVIGNVVAILGQADVEESRRGRLVQTQAVLNYFEVPPSLQEEILQFQNHILQKDAKISFAALVIHLPASIRANISLRFRLDLVQQLKMLRGAHELVHIAVAQMLASHTWCPEEYITVAGEELDEMFFINYGFLDVLSASGLYVKTLKPGECFGEEALYYSNEEEHHVCQDSVKSLTYVELLELSRESISTAASNFPRFKVEFQAFVEKWRIRKAQTSPGVDVISSFEHHEEQPKERDHVVILDEQFPPMIALQSQGSLKRQSVVEMARRKSSQSVVLPIPLDTPVLPAGQLKEQINAADSLEALLALGDFAVNEIAELLDQILPDDHEEGSTTTLSPD